MSTTLAPSPTAMRVAVLDRNRDPLSVGDRVRFLASTGCPSKPQSGQGEILGSDTYGNLLIRPDASLLLFTKLGSPAGSTLTLRFPCAFDNTRKTRIASIRSGDIYTEATVACYVERLNPPPPPPSLVKIVKPYWEQ
jgi:hypothetical protein